MVYSLDFWKKVYRMMQNIFTNMKCSEIILANANENWYINNNNKSFISDNSPYGYKKIYITHIINKLKIIKINGNQ